MIVTLLNAALPLLLALTPGAPPASPPTFHCLADTVQADELMLWDIPLAVHNSLDYGLTPDSIFVDITVLDRGVSRAPRQSTVSMGTAARAGQAISAGDEGRLSLSLNAIAERARLVIRYYAHDGQMNTYALGDSLLADGGVLSSAFPSSTLRVKGRAVETVAGPASGATGPVPGLLLVPGEDGHARAQLRTLQQYVQRGYNVLAVSPPGYGLSEGSPDWAGPATLAALEAALVQLRAMPGTDPHRIAVWGKSSGATAALLIAARHPELAAVVAQDAVYDLGATYRAAKDPLRAEVVSEAGADSATWRARSPLFAASGTRMPLLVVQDDADAAARAFLVLRPADAATDTILVPAHASRTGRRDPQRAAANFLRQHCAR